MMNMYLINRVKKKKHGCHERLRTEARIQKSRAIMMHKEQENVKTFAARLSLKMPCTSVRDVP